MKKIVISGLFLVSLTNLSAQNLSCADIVSMNDTQISNYLSQLKKSLDVKSINQNKIKNEGLYIDKIYKSTAQKNRCLLLRDASKKPVEDIKRVKALTVLSKDSRLTSSEKSIYREALSKSTNAFSRYHRASLVDSNVCGYPLLYLSAENTNNGKLFVYEKRLVGDKVKTFSKEITTQQVTMQCGSNRTTKNSYLGYLNGRGFNLPLIPSTHDVYQPNIKHKIEREALLDEFRFYIVKQFEAIHYRSGEAFTFEREWMVEFRNSKGNEVFFNYGDIRYRVGKYTWEHSTKSLEEEN